MSPEAHKIPPSTERIGDTGPCGTGGADGSPGWSPGESESDTKAFAIGHLTVGAERDERTAPAATVPEPLPMSSTSQPTDRTADGLIEVEFEITDPAYFFVGLSEAESCRVQLEEMIRLADGTLIEFFSGRECSRTAIREYADVATGIDSASVVHEGRNGVLFRVSVSGHCIVETIEGAGGIPESVAATDGAGRVTAQVPRDTDSTEVIGAVLETHPSANLVAHRQLDVSMPSFSPWGVRQILREGVTDRQWEVLRTAYRCGYFERPRAHTGEEVAEKLGISSATFSQHLRSALRNVLAAALEVETCDDA